MVHGVYGVGQGNLEGRILLVLSGERIMCVKYMVFKIEQNRKVTFRTGENETKIEFLLIKTEHRQSLQNAKAIPEEFQYAFVMADKKK